MKQENCIKFRLKEDWIMETDFLGIVEKQIIFKKGHIFEPVDDLYIIDSPYGTTMKLIQDDMRKSRYNDTLMFEEVNQDFELNTSEIQNCEDDEIKNWRIQLDVKTSFNKLKIIENFLRDNIPDYL